MEKRKLEKTIWSKEDYYRQAEAGSLDFGHPAMKKLLKISRAANTILDMGCGEGTRLYKLITKKQKGIGVDISPYAIEKARRKYPELDFLVGDLENLPCENENYDLVYSAFVFEHLDEPEKVLEEALRVLKNGGHLMIVSPNFGAPNRASPSFKGNRLAKLIGGFIKDFSRGSGLDWKKVKPIVTSNKYEIDWDTTVEPYLGSLIPFVRNLGLKNVETMSCWEKEERKVNFMQKIFRFLGEKNIYPFRNWGPHLVLFAEK